TVLVPCASYSGARRLGPWLRATTRRPGEASSWRLCLEGNRSLARDEGRPRQAPPPWLQPSPGCNRPASRQIANGNRARDPYRGGPPDAALLQVYDRVAAAGFAALTGASHFCPRALLPVGADNTETRAMATVITPMRRSR